MINTNTYDANRHHQVKTNNDFTSNLPDNHLATMLENLNGDLTGKNVTNLNDDNAQPLTGSSWCRSWRQQRGALLTRTYDGGTSCCSGSQRHSDHGLMQA